MNTSAAFPNCCATDASSAPEMTDQHVMHLETFRMMVIGFFAFIILFGVVGNILIIVTLSRWKNWKTSCNFLIANIAAADLSVVIIAAPLRIAELFLPWPSGLFLCNIVYPLQDVFVCVSIVTHSAIALERYRATVTPFKTRLSRKMTKGVILAIWVGCYVTTGIPQAIPGAPLEDATGPGCSVEVFAPPMNARIFAIYQVLLFIVVQVVIQTVAYAMVIRTVLAKDEFLNILAARNTMAPGKRSDSEVSRPSCTAVLARVKKTQRLVKLLLVLVVTFQVCHLPRGVTMLILVFSPENTMSPTYYYVSLVSLALYYLKHVVNPVILYGMSKEFQEAIRSLCARRSTTTANGRLIDKQEPLTEKQYLGAGLSRKREDCRSSDGFRPLVRETDV